MFQGVADWYKNVPIVSRWFLNLTIVITAICYLDVVSPRHLCLDPEKVIQHFQHWRFFTNFFYIEKLDLDCLMHVGFLIQSCKSLEETSFRRRTADFFYMFFFGGSILTGVVLLGGMVSESVASIPFLSNSLTFMMVYVWSRHSPCEQWNFLGLFTFTTPDIPWVLLGWFYLVAGSNPCVDVLGMLVGHVLYSSSLACIEETSGIFKDEETVDF